GVLALPQAALEGPLRVVAGGLERRGEHARGARALGAAVRRRPAPREGGAGLARRDADELIAVVAAFWACVLSRAALRDAAWTRCSAIAAARSARATSLRSAR